MTVAYSSRHSDPDPSASNQWNISSTYAFQIHCTKEYNGLVLKNGTQTYRLPCLGSRVYTMQSNIGNRYMQQCNKSDHKLTWHGEKGLIVQRLGGTQSGSIQGIRCLTLTLAICRCISNNPAYNSFSSTTPDLSTSTVSNNEFTSV